VYVPEDHSFSGSSSAFPASVDAFSADRFAGQTKEVSLPILSKLLKVVFS
jgi:hypothetical protein